MDSSQAAVPQASQRDLAAIILRNTLLASLGAWLTRLGHFLFIIYAVRTLGEVDLGRYATIVAFVGLISVFSELGMAQYVERSIAQDPARVQELFWNLVALRAILALVGVVGVTGAAFAIYDRELVFGIFLYTLTFLLAALLVPLGIVLTANERFDLATGVHLAGQVVTIGLGVALLWAGLGIYALLIPGFITMPLQIAITMRVLRRYGFGPIPFRIDTRAWGPFIRASLPFGITSLALAFNFNVDTVILGLFRSEADVGWYNASHRLVVTVIGVVGAYLVVMRPSLTREYALSPERAGAWVRTSVYWMIVFALPAGVGLSLVASDAVGLFYGKNFEPAGPVMAILAMDIPFVLLLAFFGNVTASIGRERPAAKIYVGSAVANVVLNLIFIPYYGMYGAAAITVLSDLVTVVLFMVLLRAMIDFHPRLSHTLARAGCACAAMAVVLWMAGGLPLGVMIVLGGTVYLASAVVLRLIDIPSLLASFRRMAQRIRPQQSVT